MLPENRISQQLRDTLLRIWPSSSRMDDHPILTDMAARTGFSKAQRLCNDVEPSAPNSACAETVSSKVTYLSPEQRVRKDHPLRAIRAMVDEVLKQLPPRFDKMYARVGRRSIPPEQLLRAQLLQMLYSVRSERLLMEEIDYNLLFRWFVGLNADDAVWDATVFTKNRDRLLEADVAKEFLARVVAQARAKGLASEEHFTVNGTLLEAWASAKSFQPKDKKPSTPPDDPGDPTADFVAECRHLCVTPPVAQNQGRRGGARSTGTRRVRQAIGSARRRGIASRSASAG